MTQPATLLRAIHTQPAATACPVLYTIQDERLLASRSTDGSMKLWDLRAFRSPLAAFGGLPSSYSTTSMCFSPDERLLLTGTGRPGGNAGAEDGGGSVVFVDVRRLELVRAVGMPAQVAAVNWHPRINQIIVGIGAPVTLLPDAWLSACHGAPRGPVGTLCLHCMSTVYASAFYYSPELLLGNDCTWRCRPSLALVTSPHLTSPHLTSPHLTSPHLTSPHLTSPHLTSPRLAPPHLTSPHLTSPHLTSPQLTSCTPCWSR
jgi:WD40 repeat protein